MDYTKTVMNYTGSKFKLLDQILPEMDYTKSFFVDLFAGGGSVYTNVVDKYDKILVNDVIKDLIGIHKGLVDNDEIIEDTKFWCSLKEDQIGYHLLRDSYNAYKTPEKLWALMLCCTNNMVRFNKSFGFNQTHGKRTWNDSTTKKVKAFTEHIRQYKDKLIFVSKNFHEIKINKPTMVYADPPYMNTTAGYGRGRIWTKELEEKLYKYLVNLDKNGSSFMVSGSSNHDGESCVLLDKLIADGYINKELKFDYNKVSRKGKKETTEIIIKNYGI